MIALGGAVWAALIGMNSYRNSPDNYSHYTEPLEYQCDVIFRFNILSDKGKNIRNIIEEQLNKPSDFIRDFPPLYKITESGNSFELEMCMSQYKLHHSQIIELLSDNGLISGEDYILDWLLGTWNRETKEFKIYEKHKCRKK